MIWGYSLVCRVGTVAQKIYLKYVWVSSEKYSSFSVSTVKRN